MGIIFSSALHAPLLPPCLCCPLLSPPSYHSFGVYTQCQIQNHSEPTSCRFALFVGFFSQGIGKAQFQSSLTCVNRNTSAPNTCAGCSCECVSSKHCVPGVLEPPAPLTSPFSSDWSFVCNNSSSELKGFHFIRKDKSGELHSEQKCYFYQSGISVHFPVFSKGNVRHTENINSWEFLENERKATDYFKYLEDAVTIFYLTFVVGWLPHKSDMFQCSFSRIS